MRFAAMISQRFGTCLTLHATWWQFRGKTEVNMAQLKIALKSATNSHQKSHDCVNGPLEAAQSYIQCSFTLHVYGAVPAPQGSCGVAV